MDRIIILSELGKSIAELTECSVADAENFVRELFMLAAERLESDGEVLIPEVGAFKVTGDLIEFAPDADLAAAVNAPFSAFEAVELPEDFELEVESHSEDESEVHIGEDMEPVAPLLEQECESDSVTEQQDFTAEVESPVELERCVEPDSSDAGVAQAEQDVESDSDVKRNSFGWIAWLVACVVCFISGWYFGSRNIVFAPAESVSDEVCETSEPIDIETDGDKVEILADLEREIVLEPEPEPIVVVTDTIVPGRFLTTMARQHYGQMDYWVYIYEENADSLGHPDRLGSGTVVVIPPAEKYGLVAGDDVKISEASRLAREIYQRFN